MAGSITDYLHGIRWVRDPNTATPVLFPRSSVVGLVGTAPIQLVAPSIRPQINEITLVNSEFQGGALFGPDVPGYTIPAALKAIFRQQVSLVLVVNVFNPSQQRHFKAVTNHALTFDDNNRANLPRQGVYNYTITNVAGTTTYVENTDYVIDPATGEVVRVPRGGIPVGGTVHVDFSYGVPLGHIFSITDEARTFSAQNTFQVAQTAPILNVVVKSSNGSTVYTAGSDYTVNLTTGLVTRLASGAIAAQASVLVSYDYGDPIGVQESEIIGGTTGGSTRTGMYEWMSGFAKYSFQPRILIAPGYSYTPNVASNMLTVAERLLAHTGIDAPLGTTRDEAISGRNGIGPAQNFVSASSRQVCLFPHVESVDGDIEPYSQYWAGVVAKTHAKYGFWWSPSNKEILGIQGTEYKLISSHTDSNSDVQLLNSVGVVTVYGATSESSFATAYRTWGNRSAAFPSDTDPINFIAIQVVEDQMQIALERALLPYIDRPINNVTISFILQTIKGFLSQLISIGALIDADAYFLTDDNSVEDLAAGQLTVRLEHAAPPPLEKLVIRARYNKNFLAQLGARTLGDAAVGIAGRN